MGWISQGRWVIVMYALVLFLASPAFSSDDEYLLEINGGKGQHASENGEVYGLEFEKHFADSHFALGLFYDYEVFHSDHGDHNQQLVGTQLAYISDEHFKFSVGLGAAQDYKSKVHLLTRASLGYQYLIDKKHDIYLCPTLAVDHFNQSTEYATTIGFLFHL